MLAGGDRKGTECIIGTTHFGRFAINGDLPAPGEIYLREYGKSTFRGLCLIFEAVGGIGCQIDRVAGLCPGLISEYFAEIPACHGLMCWINR